MLIFLLCTALFAKLTLISESVSVDTANGCVTDYDPQLSYFLTEDRLTSDLVSSETSQVLFAADFTVTYHNSYKVVENLRSGQSFVLYQCGTPPPEASNFSNTTTFFSVPVSKVITSGTIPVAFLDILELTDMLVMADMTYVTNECLQKRHQVCGSLVHSSAYASTWNNNATALGVQMAITDSFGGGVTGLGVDVTFDASGDNGILQRAEWIKFLALFFNAEQKANSEFQAQVDLVSSIENEVAVAQAQPGAQQEPIAAWIDRVPGWSGAPDRFEIDATPYKLEYLTKAGGMSVSNVTLEFLTDSVNGTRMKDALRGVHVVIDETYAPVPATYTRATFLANFQFTDEDIASGAWPFLTNDNVFRTDKKTNSGTYGAVGLDWYESHLPKPAACMKDFAFVLHPTLFPQYSSTAYLRNVMKDEQVMPAMAQHCTLDICPATLPPITLPAEEESGSSIVLNFKALVFLVFVAVCTLMLN